MIGHKSSVDNTNDSFCPIVGTEFCQTKELQLRNDGIDLICMILDSNLEKLFIMFQFPCQKVKIITANGIGRLHQDYWFTKLMTSTIPKLIPKKL